MKFITKHITTIGVAAIVGLLVFQLTTCFSRSKSAPDISGEIKAKDDIIEMIKTEREQDRRTFDSTIAILREQDNNKVTEYKTIVTKYEKIPVYINGLNRDSLRRAVLDY